MTLREEIFECVKMFDFGDSINDKLWEHTNEIIKIMEKYYISKEDQQRINGSIGIMEKRMKVLEEKVILKEDVIGIINNKSKEIRNTYKNIETGYLPQFAEDWILLLEELKQEINEK